MMEHGTNSTSLTTVPFERPTYAEYWDATAVHKWNVIVKLASCPGPVGLHLGSLKLHGSCHHQEM